jgi:hypothetical protein
LGSRRIFWGHSASGHECLDITAFLHAVRQGALPGFSNQYIVLDAHSYATKGFGNALIIPLKIKAWFNCNHIAALENGEAVESVRAAADETITKLIGALRTRAARLPAGAQSTV